MALGDEGVQAHSLEAHSSMTVSGVHRIQCLVLAMLTRHALSLSYTTGITYSFQI